MKAISKQLELECRECKEDENIILITFPDGEERRFHKPLFEQLFELEAKKEKKEKI